MNPACDPFADTVLDYAYNLAASGAIVVPDYIYGYNNSRSLIRMLLQRELGPDPKLALGKKDNDEIDKAVAQALAGFLKASKHQNRKVSAARAPAGANLRLIANTLGFSVVEAAVLQFAVAASREDMQELLDPISCVGLRAPAIHIAAATGLDSEEVYAALDRKGPLVMSGLIMLNDHGDLDDRVLADRRLEGIVLSPNLDAASFVDRFLPAAPPSTLVVEDFAHLKAELAMARKLLGAALEARQPGVNVLVHGPTGTGKSELARLLSGELGVPLMVAGREDSAGESPTAQERLRSLLLGNKLLAQSRMLLLFDEFEDLFHENPFAGRAKEDDEDGPRSRTMSKQWFNLLLETNPVPTLPARAGQYARRSACGRAACAGMATGGRRGPVAVPLRPTRNR
jgi:ATPase family associated with various cellular activities (AAA)